jgi:hypothetical protein
MSAGYSHTTGIWRFKSLNGCNRWVAQVANRGQIRLLAGGDFGILPQSWLNAGSLSGTYSFSEESRDESGRLVPFERVGQTAILTPHSDLHGLEIEAFTADVDKALEFVAREDARNAVVDCHEIGRVDSTGMAFFVQVWR